MQSSTIKPRRGGCLTAYLILMLIANCSTASLYLFATSLIRESLPDYPVWASPLLALFALANFGFAVALWNWKTWAMYGLVASMLVVTAINWLTLGLFGGILGLLSGLINIGVLAFLLSWALSYPRVWHLTGDPPHTIKVDHEAALSGRVYLLLDDKVIFRRGYKIWDSGLEHRFKVDGRQCLLKIIYRLWYYDYQLWVDGARLLETRVQEARNVV
jgi:hypothetical protein